MSASTISITPNPASAGRRRPVEEKTSAGVDLVNASDPVLVSATDAAAKFASADATNDLTPSIRTETTSSNRDTASQPKKSLAGGPGTATRRSSASARKAQKAEKSKWLSFMCILSETFLLLLVVVGLAQMVGRLALKNAVVSDGDGVSVISADWEAKFAEMESLVRKSTRMIEVRVDATDRKLEKHVEDVKEELKAKDVKINEQLSEMRENLEKELVEKMKNRLTKEDLDVFFKEYGEARKESDGGINNVNLDEVTAYARGIVEREIEKLKADGLGRVDYALAPGGGRVMNHSEPLLIGMKGVNRNWNSWTGWGQVHPDAVKMLSPSFGEPGQCFPLKGSSGFVMIRLRNAIIPEAVTIEHVAEIFTDQCIVMTYEWP